MKVYDNNQKNNNKRNEPFLKKIVHYVVSFGIGGFLIGFIYFLLSSFFRYNSNFKQINISLIRFFVSINYFINSLFLRKNIFKSFDKKDLPKSGHFMIFNHVNEFEYPYDFYFGDGIPAFDMGAKKIGPLFPILNRIGIPLRSGKELKKSIDEINDYLKISNIIFYPEGERTFSDIPKIYKKGILKLVYEGKHKIIVFYKGGMSKLDNNLFYYCSETINSGDFKTFEDFYQFIILRNKSFFKAVNED